MPDWAVERRETRAGLRLALRGLAFAAAAGLIWALSPGSWFLQALQILVVAVLLLFGAATGLVAGVVFRNIAARISGMTIGAGAALLRITSFFVVAASLALAFILAGRMIG